MLTFEGRQPNWYVGCVCCCKKDSVLWAVCLLKMVSCKNTEVSNIQKLLRMLIWRIAQRKKKFFFLFAKFLTSKSRSAVAYLTTILDYIFLNKTLKTFFFSLFNYLKIWLSEETLPKDFEQSSLNCISVLHLMLGHQHFDVRLLFKKKYS